MSKAVKMYEDERISFTNLQQPQLKNFNPSYQPQTFWPPSIRIRSIPKRHSEKSCKESIKEQTQKLDLEKENFDDMKVKLDASEVAKEHLSSKLKEMEVGTIDVVVKILVGWRKRKGLLRYVTLKERQLLKGFKF